jgi:hypothetical protein
MARKVTSLTCCGVDFAIARREMSELERGEMLFEICFLMCFWKSIEALWGLAGVVGVNEGGKSRRKRNPLK